MAKHLVHTGLTYEVNGVVRRAEPGETVDDIPVKSVGWLLEQGHIEPVKQKVT